MWMTWKHDPDALNSVPMRLPDLPPMLWQEVSFLYPACSSKTGNTAERKVK